jgi:hypothetical protein
MFSERVKRNTIALSVTIIVNFVICVIVAIKAYEALYWVGLGFAPLFGGIFRSIVAFKKDVIPIIFITAVIDTFALVPLINYLWYDGTSDYLFGALMGAIAAVFMMIVGFITLLIRHIIEKKKIKEESQ